MKSFFRLYAMAGRRLGPYLAGLGGSALAGAAGTLFIAMLTRAVFDAMAARQLGRLWSAMVIYLGLLLLTAAVAAFSGYLQQASAAKIVGEVRKTVFARAQRLPMSYHDLVHTGDTISRLTNDIAAVEPAYTDLATGVANNLFGGISALVYLTLIDFRLTALAVGFSLLGLLVNATVVGRLRALGRSVQERLAGLTETLSDIPVSMLAIKTFNLQDVILKAFRDQNQKALAASLQRVRRSAPIYTLQDFMFFANHIGILGVAAYFYLQRSLALGDVLAALVMFTPIFALFRSLAGVMTQAQSVLAAADRIFEIIDREPESKLWSGRAAPGEDVSLRLTGVRFTYAGQNTPALDGVSLEVGQGQKVALVGPVGSGKSTVFKLILGLYKPAGGVITLGGVPLEELSLDDLRSRMALVPQNVYLFSGTIAENIRFGRLDASMEEIIAAAKAAKAHDFISSLQEAYEARVGEHGSQLSGGQKQQIAIARAVVRNTPLLLLDEATSSLDSESERLIHAALDALMAERTTLVIAHRLSTVTSADRIYVMEKGHIVESGTHAELLARGGLYSQLFETQFGAQTM